MADIEAFAGFVDLASRAVGGEALLCSDDFFAGMERLLDPKPAHFDPTTYTDRGKEMDGWESRRKRAPGHDWCILRLGIPGRVRGVDVDTSFFLGNHPPFASLDATVAAPDATAEHLRDHAHHDDRGRRGHEHLNERHAATANSIEPIRLVAI
jgi:allantoicase